jgi:hypothetical protein
MPETSKTTPDEIDRIRELAYQKFLARNRKNGHDLEDWLAAEQEVLNGEAAEENIARQTFISEGNPVTEANRGNPGLHPIRSPK